MLLSIFNQLDNLANTFFLSFFPLTIFHCYKNYLRGLRINICIIICIGYNYPIIVVVVSVSLYLSFGLIFFL